MPKSGHCLLPTTRTLQQNFGTVIDRQNLMRLHKALQSEARLAVTSLLIFPENVPLVIEELEFHFGRPELLVCSELNKLQAVVKISDNHLENILPFANTVKNIFAFFKSANLNQHLANPTLLEQLVSKLPPKKQSTFQSKLLKLFQRSSPSRMYCLQESLHRR